MRGKNPAWVVPISDEEQIATANLSGAVIRRYSPEPLVAFVSRSIQPESIIQLRKAFDHVILALEGTHVGKDSLLVETLTLTLFSSLVVVRDGALVFWKFDEALETGTAFLQSSNRKKDWMLVSVTPDTKRYSEALSILQEGKSVDSKFVMESIANGNKRGLLETLGVSWSDLKYFDGVKMPLVQLGLEAVKQGKHYYDDKLDGFWQKVIYSALAPLVHSGDNVLNNMAIPIRNTVRNESDWVAVVGMSCRFPGANSVDEYWQLLSTGLCTASAPPQTRLGKCELTEEMRANFLKCPIDEFDASFFKIPPSTAAATDPQARLLLEVSWEAFEDAGINPEKIRAAPVGVFHGSWIQEYKDMLNLEKRSDVDFVKKYTGNGFSSTASKLSFFYGFTGPNIATESGCCSSMVAVQLACENLQNGQCPIALATGANMVLQMDQQQKVLWATDGICRSFDSQGNGYGRAEGIGVLVLKRYSDAIRDGDRIHGIILASGITQEGLTTSFGTPTVENEARTMSNALRSAKVRPVDVDYVEAHATGTVVGDPIEAEAIVSVYSSPSPRQTPLIVGSVKTNIGHAESCSGIASIIKVLLAMKHETIPAHINVKNINTKVDFSPIPGKLTLQNEPWKRSPERPRIAGVSNFGISGADVHMLIQEPPQQSLKENSSKLQAHILTLSAKTSVALDQLALAYMKMLETGNESLADISYTATACRAHLNPCRRAIVASTKEQLVSKLKEPHPSQPNSEVGANVGVCFISYDNIDDSDFEEYKDLYSQFPVFQIHVDACDAVCKEIMAFSPVAYLLSSSSSSSLSWERIEQRQACSFSITYSLYKLWESWGIKGSTMLGINFGELVGAAITGKLELAQCFQLILHKNVAAVQKKGENGSKPAIRYISADKGGQGLDMEHWANMCCKKNDSRDQLEETSLEETNFDIFIHLNIKGNLEMKRGRQLPPTGDTGLAGLLTSLATLYTTGFPVDWEGFHAHQIGNKVALPGYPFQRKSLWFKKGKTEATPSQHWNNNSLHPLLGSYASSASSERNSEELPVHIFENQLVAHERAPYLSAHVIASEMIFPATAHLELLLAAGHVQGEAEMPHIIENFVIHQPLHLSSSSAKPLRTSMVQIGTGWNIVVESQTESDNWKRYASGDITILQTREQPQHPNLEELKRQLVVNEHAAFEFYEKIAQLGLNFGKEFKSLKNIYESESTDEILAEVAIPRDAVHYVCHPLLADAMLQCFIFHKHAQLTSLKVPVRINKFVAHRRLRPSDCLGSSAFIYFNEQLQTVFLLDSHGAPIASMTEPQFKATTVGSVLEAAGCTPKKTMDGELDIWKVVWKPATKYQSEGSLSPGLDFTQSPGFINLLRVLEPYNVFLTSEKELFSQIDRLSELFVYKAFHELGWKPKQGESVLVSELAAEFHIAPNFLNAFRYFLSYFENNRVVQLSDQMENTTMKVLRLPEGREMVENSIAQLLQVLEDYESIQSLVACASVLAPVMQGNRKGQHILFEPGDGGVTHADLLYKGNAFYKNSAKAAPKIFIEIATQLWDNEGESGQESKLRILEIGGGTGVFTSSAIPLMEEEGIEYSYHFTDISSHFLKKAASRFPHLIYRTLDLEKDPLEQGFPPAYFDIVIGLDVVHATKNLRRSVRHLKMLLKTGGHLLLGETSKPMKEFDVTFGILDGYWNFEDHEVRSNHCTISADQWQDLLSESGFRGPSSSILLANNHLCVVVGTLSHPQPDDEKTPELMKSWLLLHDMNEKGDWLEGISKRMWNLGRRVISQEIKESLDIGSCIKDGANFEGILCLFQGADGLASNNCRNILDPLLLASKVMIEKGSWSCVPRLCVATSGLWMECGSESSSSAATAWGFVRSARMEVPWLTTKLVDLDPDVELELRMDALLQEIWMGDDESEAVYREGVRYTRRLNLENSEAKHVAIPNSKDYTIQLPASYLLQDLLFVPKATEALADDQVIVEVRAAALNFRDVFSVLKPSERFKDLDTMGMDFSGVVSSVGSGVTELVVGTPIFGVCLDSSTISSCISVPTQNLLVVPDALTFAEAATLPVAFLTAWHCLVDVARASARQTILIHAASGGVGLVAIQIAKHLGLIIVATAGSQRKRKYLRNLGIPHVFNSRTLEFGQQIKEITNGEGVDIVLNCLTGPGFKETSLEVCKNGGHFVEISKLDIWEEREVQVKKPGVNYKIVDLSVAEPKLVARLLESLSKMLSGGFLKPLPYTRYTASRIVPALQFLQKAKQVGKVVVEMPTFDPELNRLEEQLFNERSSYLITGGKGAIGLAIAEWMVAKGAQYIVLLGRSPPSQKAVEMIQKLEQVAGVKIVSMESDVGDYDQMARVFEDIQSDPNLPPLRGIHHCAGVLSDDMVVNQDWASFEYSLNPKVKGSYNLHLFTSQIPLEFFVVHSSLTCVLGNPGQSNHTSGCLYTEALMESRVSNGLPGMSISWGHWDAGLAENLELETVTPFTIPQGIAALERFVLENRVSGGAGFIIPSKMCGMFPAYEKTFLEAIPLQIGVENGRQAEETKESLPEAYEKANEEHKLEVIKNVVKNTLCDTLGVSFQEVGETVQFSRMGLDSLMNIEFYNKLQCAMGKVELGYIDMEEQGTVEQLSAIIKTALEKALG